MRRLILNILAFLFFSALFSLIIVFLPPRLWDAAVVLFAVLIFLNKKSTFIFGLTLIAGLFLEMISNVGSGIQITALFAALFPAYLLKNQLLKLNRWVAFVLNIACATVVYRLFQIILSALSENFSSGFFQTIYDFTDTRLLLIALAWNIFLSFLFIMLYNAAKKRLLERFFVFR